MSAAVQRAKLLRGLVTNEIAYNDPFYAVMDLTRRCNLQCPGCRYHGQDALIESPGDQSVKDIPLDLARQVIEEMGRMQTAEVTFIGEGEPFLYPHLFEVIRITKNAGLQAEIITNGTLIDEEAVDRLIESGLDKLKVSLWASSPEEYERHHPGSSVENFRRTTEGVRLLSRRKLEAGSKTPSIMLHQPIDRDNFPNVGNLANLAHELGCQKLSFSPFHARKGALSKQALLPEQEEDLPRALTALKVQLRNWGMCHNIDETLLRYETGEEVWEKVPCYIGWLHVRIKVDGTVVPCNPCNISMGNIRDNTLREIWNGPEFRAFRRRAMTPEGLVSMAADCDCGFCCQVANSWKVHRYYKWIAPLVPGRGLE